MNAAANDQHREHPLEPMREESNERFESVGSTANEPSRSLTELLRRQASHVIDWTLEAELQMLLAQHATVTDASGHPAYVRNGYQPARALITNLGPIRIRIPKIRSRVDRPVIFHSALARPYLRRARTPMHKAPARFLRGLSAGDLHEAICALMGPEAAALPGPVLRRLSARWEGEHKRWLTGSLTDLRGILLWLDSIDGGDPPHGIGPVMVAVGANESAREHLLSVVHGSDETEQGWVQVLRGLQIRGMPAPVGLHPLGKASRAIAAATASIYPETAVANCRDLPDRLTSGTASA